MNMKYKLLDNGKAVVLTRRPELVYDELCVDFSGAPSGATAIFECGDKSLYRSLNGVTCSVPADKLDGTVRVTVALLDGSARPCKWSCEELLAEKQKFGGTLISPNDMDMPQKFVELMLEYQSLRRCNERLEMCVKDLEGRLEKLLEGYDLI